MKFEEALKYLKQGDSITRKCESWKNYYLALVQDEGDSIQLFDNDGWVDCNHAVSNSDLLAEDWIFICRI